ncbi:TIGR03118 family protein [Massilia psychrophila]|uniref:TIGR03118 family protein n=1 Tax=Massilia psychrophila TaxID=1603353 RepID=A0A2G8T0V0_9BURK|nr:TIGR03118 family protein [Massilia psychrophila]PIL39649.1 TIGR03118 family protein [Massilia psychrophila]GGE74467.1 hypothetical protein GCM10008020_18890 [Massilia psychrophila]
MNTFRHHHAARLACTLALAATAATTPALADTARYQQRNLVANTVVLDARTRAENVDPNLVDPWGLAFNPFGFAWLSERHTGASTQYNGDGHPQALVVTIPPAVGSTAASGKPTGIVWNGGPGFVVRQGKQSAPSQFIFACADGSIAAWAPTVDATHAVRVFPRFYSSNALYTGLAIGADGARQLLFAADFRNNRVDVFDTNFAWIVLPGRPFVDPQQAPGYAPFGIQAINGNVYVTYAKQEALGDGRVGPASGGGFVSVFAPDGRFLRRLVSNGPLDKPWGLALAPAGFGRFGNRLLVANAGNGAINAFDSGSGKFAGRLRGANGQPIAIDGLKAIGFGHGLTRHPVGTLYFSAGPGNGRYGLYGRLDAMASKVHEHDVDVDVDADADIK